MIHQYKLNGYNIVLDVYSGAIHAVDEVAYDIISMYESYSKEEIISSIMEKYAYLDISEEDIVSCLEDVAYLEESGQLFSRDTYKGLKLKMKENPEIKALCLHVAHTCNLSCEYCFAKQGTYHGENAIMSFEVAKRAIDFLIENSGNRKNLEVDFFGGEPLINWKVVKDVVAYARSIEKDHNKNFRFTLTTNGVLLDDEVIEFANREMHNVVLSLDGRKESNDRFRVDINGRGSYDRIVPNFKKLVESRGDKSYYIRGTYTHYNRDFTEDVFHMADLGFRELSMEPVVAAGDSPAALTDEDLPFLFDQYEILAKEMLRREEEGRPFNFYHYTINLQSGPCIYKRIAGCGSGTEYMAVTPTGDLFPCHQFVNDKEKCLGNVFDGITRNDLRNEFGACNIYTRDECQDCWAKLYCAGGCPANAYHARGDISKVYEYGCKLFRKRMECAIMMNVARSEE
ncbi:thioether cross-link-forming SCIFF peptide maturase [Peptoniphilaceae bacterium SGI.131]